MTVSNSNPLFTDAGQKQFHRLVQAARNGGATVRADGLQLNKLELCPPVSGAGSWSKSVLSFLTQEQQETIKSVRNSGLPLVQFTQFLELVLGLGANIEKHFSPDDPTKLVAITIAPVTDSPALSPADQMLAHYGKTFEDCFTTNGLAIFAQRWLEMQPAATNVEHKPVGFAVDRSGKTAMGMFDLTPNIPAGRMVYNLLRIDAFSQCDEDFVKLIANWANGPKAVAPESQPEVTEVLTGIVAEIVGDAQAEAAAKMVAQVQPEIAAELVAEMTGESIPNTPAEVTEVPETPAQRNARLLAAKRKAA